MSTKPSETNQTTIVISPGGLVELTDIGKQNFRNILSPMVIGLVIETSDGPGGTNYKVLFDDGAYKWIYDDEIAYKQAV